MTVKNLEVGQIIWFGHRLECKLTKKPTIIFSKLLIFAVNRRKMKNAIAENVRKIRMALGYSQEYVAKKMHMSQQSYSQLERHPEESSLTRLKNLSEVLQVSLLSLIGEDETYVQTNLNQSGGHAATKMVFHQGANSEVFIQHLQEEIAHLRKENLLLIGTKS
jgi:transcriptional regulator with XRE-family HTH domain